ncbi:hypothetical protein CHLNCDRAFT_22427, partial [Chlorella variabilis]
VDFDTKVLSGHVDHTVTVRADGAAELALDMRDVAVSGITVNGAAAEYSLAEPYQALGSKLSIQLPPGLKAGDTVAVGISFETSPQASAVQWLPPEQTAGKRHPYLFTQCQAIHARSILPCQDTPGAKFSYGAAVRVPQALRALMSAVPLLQVAQRSKAGTRVYRFKQAVPIPSYLLALAVGNLESRELGPISAVWSEPEMVEAGAYEFAETSKFLDAAEQLAGPYQWGRYDLLLLPPSFPYGGMENPCLTFVTPTLLAGDRSLANVVAHEIAHSWTGDGAIRRRTNAPAGNLVTNATWEHFWLNEGFTVFLERKILGRLYGEQMYQLQASMGWLELQDAVKSFGEGHAFTALVPNLSGGVDPDDAFSSIPYEKGFAFIHYLQELVGGSSAFEPFFKRYVQRFAATPLTSDDFRAFFCDYFKDNAAIAQVDWDTWFYKPGMPPVKNEYDESLGQLAYELAKRRHPRKRQATSSWRMARPFGIAAVPLPPRSLLYRCAAALPYCRMNELYDLDNRHNSEIRSSWFQLCINAGDDSVLPLVKGFLQEQGRMKFLRPLYRALHNSKSVAAKQAALDTYHEHKSTYHPIAGGRRRAPPLSAAVRPACCLICCWRRRTPARPAAALPLLGSTS